MKGGVKFSADRHYRYVLTRRWGSGRAYMVYIMLNPSTADAQHNDPTIRRCIDFARSTGYSGIIVVNLYAKRATDPRDLIDWDDPVGPDNDRWIRWAVSKGRPIIAAWGNSVHKVPGYEKRIEQVLKVIDYPFGVYLDCFGRTRLGQPRHPLMLKKGTNLESY